MAIISRSGLECLPLSVLLGPGLHTAQDGQRVLDTEPLARGLRSKGRSKKG